MNVCDKFIESGNSSASALAYSGTSYVGGKFYTEDEKIGQVESYLKKYYDLRNDYKKSFAGVVFTYSGVDAIGKSTFTSLSTTTEKGLKVSLTNECVSIANVYNEYKENFEEKEFEIATEEGVRAVQNLYGAAKGSEVLKSLVVEVVPKLVQKWENDEKYLGIEMPVSGDMKEIALDILEVFNTDDFNTMDENINVLFEAMSVANENGVLEATKNGGSITNVIDRGTFVKDEILVLAESSRFKQALPQVLTTVVKIAYKDAIGDPGTSFDQLFTQEQIAALDWNREAENMQTIVSGIYKFIDSDNVIDNLGEIGEVIDASRESVILSTITKTFMVDYIENNVSDSEVGADAKATLIDSVTNDWTNKDYSYKTLFNAISKTAKIAESITAEDVQDMGFDELSEVIRDLIVNDKDGQVKDTIKTAIGDGVLENLLGDEELASAFGDMIVTLLDNTTEATVETDLDACQVIANIINCAENNEGSVLDKYPADVEHDKTSADVMVETLTKSEAVMSLLITESNKVDSVIKAYIDNLKLSDRTSIQTAIEKLENGDNKTALSKLFGLIV